MHQVRFELEAGAGQITLSSVAGLVFDTGNGESDNFATFTGHPGDINRALRGAVYRGLPDRNTLGQMPHALSLRISNSHAGLGGTEPVAVEAEHTLW